MAIDQTKLKNISRQLADIAEQTSRLTERVRSEGITQNGRVLLPPERTGVRDVRLEGGQPLELTRETSQTAGTAGVSAGQSASPYQVFSQRLREMLTQAQQGITPQVYGLEGQALGLEAERTRAGMQTSEELIGAPPSLQAGVRGAEMGAFEPGIQRIRQVGESLGNKLTQFEKILGYAKEFGEGIEKYIKPDEATIKAVEAQIRAGSTPSSAVMDKVSKYLPTDVWSDWAEANRKGEQAKTDELTRYQKLTNLNSIRTAARQDPDIKIFSDIRGAYEQGRAAYRKGITGAAPGVGDIVLMRTIAKITDPTSSVREEEFATFESAQATLAKFGISLTKKMWSGDRLTDAGRKQLFGMLQDIYNQRKGAYDNAWNFYDQQGQELGEPSGQVLPRYYAPETSENIITAPDGSRWQENQDGSLTQIK